MFKRRFPYKPTKIPQLVPYSKWEKGSYYIEKPFFLSAVEIYLHFKKIGPLSWQRVSAHYSLFGQLEKEYNHFTAVIFYHFDSSAAKREISS